MVYADVRTGEYEIEFDDPRGQSHRMETWSDYLYREVDQRYSWEKEQWENG